MKELTIEQKAQRYDEAIERAKGVIEQNPLMEYLKKGIEYIFPELKESEDERIRKEIIDFIYDKTDTYELREKSNSWLAWLEKQGDKDKLIQELGEYKVKYTQEVLEKHLKIINKNDERLRKTTIAFLKDFAEQGYENAVECIDWLEKQGEQKHTDKIESKFKVGDIITNGKIVGKVDENENNKYHGWFGYDKDPSVHYADIPNVENWHLWTIQDAKDGDVLSYRNGQWIFIFKALENNNSIIEYYTLLSENGLSIKDAASTVLISSITPATKEQRNQLEKAMANAGWEFDFEKKELKKI